MSQKAENLIINDFNEEKEIVININFQDVFLNDVKGFDATLNLFTSKFKEILSGYRDIPSTEKLKSISLDEALDYFDGVGLSNAFFKNMRICANKLCESLGCSFSVYGISAFTALWFLAKEEPQKASKYVLICLQPLLLSVKNADAAKSAGMLGGRPEHKLKREALDLARQKWVGMERASLNTVATAVSHQLSERYKSPPSVPAIKKWITAANIRPSK